MQLLLLLLLVHRCPTVKDADVMLNVWQYLNAIAAVFPNIFPFVLWYSSNSSSTSNQEKMIFNLVNILHTRRYNKSLRYCVYVHIVCRMSLALFYIVAPIYNIHAYKIIMLINHIVSALISVHSASKMHTTTFKRYVLEHIYHKYFIYS